MHADTLGCAILVSSRRVQEEDKGTSQVITCCNQAKETTSGLTSTSIGTGAPEAPHQAVLRTKGGDGSEASRTVLCTQEELAMITIAGLGKQHSSEASDPSRTTVWRHPISRIDLHRQLS